MPLSFPIFSPTLVGSVVTAPGLAALHRLKMPADAVELRVDALLKAKVRPEEIEAALRKHIQPALLTLRLPAEGGLLTWKKNQREELFLRLLPQVEAIDIELASVETLAPILAEALRSKKTVIFSAHAIKKPATPKQFVGWLEQFQALAEANPRGAFVLKIAGWVDELLDLQRLAVLQANAPEIPVAVMGLGPQAAISRTVLAALGSRLIYGYLDEPAAAGQPSALDVRRALQAE